MGTSIRTRQPITADVAARLPATLELVFFGILFAALIGIPIGVLAAARRGGVVDTTSRIFSVGMVSLPTFWLALVLQIVFFGMLHWLPLQGRISRDVGALYPFQSITGFYTVDSALAGNWVAFGDVLVHLLLPATCVASFALGLTIRMTRANMLDVLSQPYILAARAAGLAQRTILLRLALKNAIVPTLFVLGLTTAYALTGAIVVEYIFAWPGIGNYLLDGIRNLDYPVVVAVTLVSTTVYVLVNLILDVAQPYFDPRISLG
jgi:peptide/nickel transport system permease protein